MRNMGATGMIGVCMMCILCNVSFLQKCQIHYGKQIMKYMFSAVFLLWSLHHMREKN